MTVAHAGGTGADGTDTLQHIERLQFADNIVSVDGSSDPGGEPVCNPGKAGKAMAMIEGITAGDDAIVFPAALSTGSPPNVVDLQPAASVEVATVADAGTADQAVLPPVDELAAVGLDPMSTPGSIASTPTTTPDDFRLVA